MRRIDTLVIGGGQAGLAMSHSLQGRGIDHVVLERGQVAERWRSERWESLHLLTPNWLNRLPGFAYDGPDPDGFMSVGQLVDYFDRYARTLRAPVQGHTTVQRVTVADGGYLVDTDRGSFRARCVVVATGQCDVPHLPRAAQNLSPRIEQVVPPRYRRPALLPPGGVLVVGASATGVQLAEEIQASGRQVTLAVGQHTRMPRRYRGRDIMYWLDLMGVLSRGADDVSDLAEARDAPSLQLVGRPDHRSIDLDILQRCGVRLTGRLRAADGHRVRLEDDLSDNIQQADGRLDRVLRRVDDFADRNRLGERDERPAPIVAKAAPTELDLGAEGIKTVLWATGFRRRYPWLQVPVLDGRGEILHDGGVTRAPGLYVLGLSFLQRRDSSFIGGVGRDARVLSSHIEGHLAGFPAAA